MAAARTLARRRMGACETTPPATHREPAHDPDKPTATDPFPAPDDLPPLAGVKLVRPLRAHYAELVPLRVGKDSPGLSAGLPDIYPARPQRKKPAGLLLAIRSAGGEVKMHAVLDRLGIGDRHEAHADGCVLAGPDDDLVLALGQDLPAGRLCPEPGQAGQVVSVNDDAAEPDGHVASMRGALDCLSRTRNRLALTECTRTAVRTLGVLSEPGPGTLPYGRQDMRVPSRYRIISEVTGLRPRPGRISRDRCR